MARPPFGYWAVTLARAVAALVVGLVITFTADHSPVVGFNSIALFAFACGVVLAVGAALHLPAGRSRILFAIEALVLLAGAVAAILLNGFGVATLLFLSCVVFGLSGIVELVTGLLEKTQRERTDWIFVGSLSALLAIVALVVPTGYAHHFTGPDGIARTLTASVVLVGAIGAYAVILGVYLTIGGLSQYWARKTPAYGPEKTRA